MIDFAPEYAAALRRRLPPDRQPVVLAQRQAVEQIVTRMAIALARETDRAYVALYAATPYSVPSLLWSGPADPPITMAMIEELARELGTA